jgi:hypothetical protein
MAARRLIFLFFVGWIVSQGCAQKSPQSTNGIIDQSYLEDKDFQNFQNRYEREQQRRQQLTGFHTRFIRTHFSDAKKLSLPLTIKGDRVKKLLSSTSSRNPFGQHSYRALGKVELLSFELFLFFQKRFSVYRNALLIGATVRDGTILDIQPLTLYRKNIIEQIQSRIKIDDEGNIQLNVEYMVQYPEPQEIESISNYMITPDGYILTGKGLEAEKHKSDFIENKGQSNF